MLLKDQKQTKKERIALFTCMPPVRSGVVEYSNALIKHLGDFYDIDVYCGAFEQEVGERTYHHSQFLYWHLEDPYKAIVYQLGNHESFSFIYSYIGRYPGITILHDVVLYQSRAKYLINSRRHREYEEEMQYCHGYSGKRMAQVSLKYPMPGYVAFLFTMNKLVIERSLAIGVHTKYYCNQLQFEHPMKKIFYVPISLDMPAIDISCSDARQKYNIAGEKILIGSAGFVDKHKGVRSIIEAIIKISEKQEVHFIWLGEDRDNAIANYIETRADAEEREVLRNRMTITGYLEEKEFLSYLGELDIFVNLRYPTAGEFSGVLWLAFQKGIATLISDLPHLHEIPDDCVRRVSVTMETESLLQGLQSLISSKEQRMQLGENAKEYVRKNHTMQKMVETYRELIEEVSELPSIAVADTTLPRHWQTLTLNIMLSSLMIDDQESWKSVLEQLHFF